jgi:hypothetical protein
VLAFEGTDAHGSPVKLTRKGQLWDLSVSDAETREVALDEVLRQLAAGSFRFEGMTVVPDIADHLFKHAVEQAEESLAKYLEAEQELGAPEARSCVTVRSGLLRVPAQIGQRRTR